MTRTQLHLLVEVVFLAVLKLTESYELVSDVAADNKYSSEMLKRSLYTYWGRGYNPKDVEGWQFPTMDLLEDMRVYAPISECRQDLDEILQSRAQLNLWALKMTYSSVRLPDALISASMYHLGNYDECVSTRTRSWQGSYCLANVNINPAWGKNPQHMGDERSPFSPQSYDNTTIWDFYEISGNRRRFRRDEQQWGLCVPASCERSEVVTMLSAALGNVSRALRINIDLNIPRGNCGVLPPPVFSRIWDQLSKPAFALGTVFIFSFVVVASLASLRRVYNKYIIRDMEWPGPPEKQGLAFRILNCFTVQDNWKNLKRKQKSHIHCIQGVRTLTMFGVILGHRCLINFAGPLHNPEYVEEAFTDVLKMYIINGNVIVSTFFVISGFLEARLMLREFDTIKTFNICILITHYVHRYLRLLPTLAVVITVDTLWVEHFGSGPLWNQVVGRSVRDCKSFWWLNLLFLQNYLKPESLCMIQTWYVAADMQLYLVMPLVMWIVWRCRKSRQFLVLVLLFIFAFGSLYFTTVKFNLHPTLFIMPQLVRRQSLWTDPTFLRQYQPAHTNAISYVVGLSTGTLYYYLHKSNYKPTKNVALLLWMGVPIMHCFQSVSIYSALLFFRPGYEPHLYLDALYGPIRLILFAVPTAWVIFTCSIGAGGVWDWFFTYKPFVVLGRLTYCAYLVHISIINPTAGSLRMAEYLSEYTIATRFLSDVVITYIFALALHLCVESPMWNIQKMILQATVLKKLAINAGDSKEGSQHHEETNQQIS